ncbi:MAG: alpha/beta fold hydrolase [Frankiaceae bacterium]
MTVALHASESGTGRPLVLLHAFPLSSAMWDDQRAELATACRLITPDQRGFGGSPLGGDEPSLHHAADDLAALLDARGIDRAVVGGLSMGGYVALALARRHPDRLDGLVLADTRASADPAPAAANRERIAAAVLADPGSTVLADEVLPGLLGATTWEERPSVVERVRALVEAAPPAAVAWAQRAMAAREDSYGVLRALRVPVLVIVGDEDGLTPVADAEAMAAAAPEATLAVLLRAGHLSAMEAPQSFNGAVRAFLDRLAG